MRRGEVEIIAEGIWKNGAVARERIPWPGCSTGVAMMRLRRFCRRTTPDPWLTRILHDGVLVREFDSERQAYTLCLEANAADQIPAKVPVKIPRPGRAKRKTTSGNRRKET